MKIPFVPLLLIVGAIVRAAAQDVSTNSHSPDVITVAVFDFGSPYKMRLRNDIGLVSSVLTANLSSSPQFILVDRTQLKKVLKEQAFGLSGNISPETAAKIGQLVGAKVLVTGQIFSVGDSTGTDKQEDGAQTSSQSEVLIIAKIIGTETGRVFSQREQGARENLVKLADDLSAKISETITNQYTNFVAAKSISTGERLAEIINSINGKSYPTVSIQIDEQLVTDKKPGLTVQTEFGRILQEAGFEVVDGQSDKQPDVLITGTATTSANGKGSDGLISASANLDVKIQERLTGKILLLDSQNSTAIDLGKHMAAKKALADAADNLLERLLPVLAQNSQSQINHK